MRQETPDDATHWVLFGYVKLNDFGFALPCFHASGESSQIFTAISARSVFGCETYTSFYESRFDEVKLLQSDKTQKVQIGSPWIDVFIWRDEPYVGEPNTLWSEMLAFRSDIEQEAPLSLLDLAERVSGVETLQFVRSAFSYLFFRFGEAQARHWRDKLYFRPRALRVLISILQARYPDQAIKVSLRDLDVLDEDGHPRLTLSNRMLLSIGSELNSQLVLAESEMKIISDALNKYVSNRRPIEAGASAELRKPFEIAKDAKWRRDVEKAHELCDLSAQSGSLKPLSQAISLYEMCIGGINKIYEADEWIEVQVALGHSLRVMGERVADQSFFQRAVVAYESALDLVSPTGRPDTWAKIQCNIGVSLRQLGERDGDIAVLQRSLKHLEAFLAGYDRHNSPHIWALFNKEIGNTYRSIGQHSGRADLCKKASDYHFIASQIFTRSKDIATWVQLRADVGRDLFIIGESESGTKTLRRALKAFEDALFGIDRKRNPLEWASVESNRGNVLFRIGVREASISILRRALRAQRDAVEERTKQRAPYQWAATQNNIGTVLFCLGDLESNAGLIWQGIAYFESALEEYDTIKTPMDWALTMNNLGSALRRIGRFNRDVALLDRAAASFEKALEVFQSRRNVGYASVVSKNLQQTLSSSVSLSTSDHADRMGVVRWFNKQTGFGYITPDSGEQDVFVHIQTVHEAGLGTLDQGQKVNFSLSNDMSVRGAFTIRKTDH